MADNDQVGAGRSVNRSGEETPDKEREPSNAKLDRRRKFLIGGLATAPVIATLSSRPAWAGANCPYSDRLSDHLSEDPVTCYGDNLQEWQAHPERIEGLFDTGPEHPVNGHPDYTVLTNRELRQLRRAGILTPEEVKEYKEERNNNPGQTFVETFGVTPIGIDVPPDATLMQCLYEGNLDGQCVAAYCNVLYHQPQDFGYSETGLRNLVASLLHNDPEQLHSILAYMNANLQGANPFLPMG
ncbi:MAG: hypothetical protein AAF495_13165 [Pseudomonadota bacterium]